MSGATRIAGLVLLATLVVVCLLFMFITDRFDRR
jgi:hypothetical protein